MKATDMHYQPGYLFRRMHQLSTSAFSRINGDVNLTSVQFSSLLVVRDNPGIDATRLAERIRFDRTTIGHVIELLEQKGFILRRAGDLDKRTKQLEITDKGRKAAAAAISRVPDITDTILEPLSASEREELLRILCKLDTYATEGNPEPMKTGVA